MLASFTEVRLLAPVPATDSAKSLVTGKSIRIEALLVRLGLKHRIPVRLRNRVRKLITGVDMEKTIASGFRVEESVPDFGDKECHR